MNCVICLSQAKNPETLSCCSKTYCFQCISAWMQVRNCCPACIKTIGNQSKNTLLNHGHQQFDNGCLALQTEMQDILRRVEYLQILIKSKRQTANNYKTRFPQAHLLYVESQMQKVYINMDIASIAITENDRTTASTSIQVVAELILTIQAILQGESTLEHQYYSSDQDYADYDYEQQQLHRQIRQIPVKKNSNRNPKRNHQRI